MSRAGKGVTIIKRRKVIADAGHHGGAWKVAYADFVTAMMAFFLLMWLLNATTEDQRKGLAEYFDPKAPVARVSGGGTGVFGGDSVFAEDVLSQNGTGAAESTPMDNNQSRGDSGVESDDAERRRPVDEPATAVAELEQAFKGMSGESDVEDPLLSHVRLRVTDDGLIIELFDVEGSPLFASGSAKPSPAMTELLQMVGEVAALLKNPVAIDGHTDAGRFASKTYGNWELSTDRANAARRLLNKAGVAPERIARVTGKADHDLADPENPLSPRNRRVAITILRGDRKGDDAAR